MREAEVAVEAGHLFLVALLSNKTLFRYLDESRLVNELADGLLELVVGRWCDLFQEIGG